MDEYISRENVLKAFNLIAKNPNKDYQRGMQDTIDCLVPEVIADIPSADVQPVKRGRWINHRINDEKSLLHGAIKDTTCSECGKSTPYRTDYCMHCGARMDLGEKNNEI